MKQITAELNVPGLKAIKDLERLRPAVETAVRSALADVRRLAKSGKNLDGSETPLSEGYARYKARYKTNGGKAGDGSKAKRTYAAGSQKPDRTLTGRMLEQLQFGTEVKETEVNGIVYFQNSKDAAGGPTQSEKAQYNNAMRPFFGFTDQMKDKIKRTIFERLKSGRL